MCERRAIADTILEYRALRTLLGSLPVSVCEAKVAGLLEKKAVIANARLRTTR